MRFNLFEWDKENRPQYGLYKIRFNLKLPDWLPQSQLFVQTSKFVKAQVRYLLVAQLVIDKKKDDAADYMIGKLPELGMSKIRHELQIVVNLSDAVPYRGIQDDISH